MKSQLKIAFFLILSLLLSFWAKAQDLKYYIETGTLYTEVTKDKFTASIDYSKNVDVYLKKDSGNIGVILKRKREGKLDVEQLNGLKKQLEEKTGLKIENEEYIVINYITWIPEMNPSERYSKWTILDGKYPKHLHELLKVKDFFIYNAIQDKTPKYYKRKHIQWFVDTDNYLVKLLFPVQANYGNAAVIRPDGTYKIYLGEYGPEQVYSMITELQTMP